MKKDGFLLAHALAEAMLQVWATNSEDNAVKFLEGVAARDKDVGITWMSFDNPQQTSPLTPDQREHLRAGQVLVTVEPADPAGNLHTYLGISGPEGQSGAIQITESLAAQHRYVISSAIRLGVTVLIILLLGAALAFLIGHRWVGRPISDLIAKTQRVAEGDLLSPVVALPKDELGTLGSALNTMSDEIFEARNRQDAEYLKRLTTEAQLRHAQRLTTVGTLASGVAHEIGTPLNVISAHAKMIVRRQVDANDAIESCSTIVEQTERITEIVKQLLGFARRKSPKKEAVDLGQLVKESAALLRSTAKQNNVTIITPQSESHRAVFGDASQLQQVIANLVNNGVQAMPQGGNLTVSISVQRTQPPSERGSPEGEYVNLRVEDEGQGIEESDLVHIFDPFFTTKPVGEGTGLGLSVSHGIVRDHQGWIEVESEVGKGTRFSVYLPPAAKS
ncbi:ATP-binding protein [Myxococcota bacterium]